MKFYKAKEKKKLGNIIVAGFLRVFCLTGDLTMLSRQVKKVMKKERDNKKILVKIFYFRLATVNNDNDILAVEPRCLSENRTCKKRESSEVTSHTF